MIISFPQLYDFEGEPSAAVKLRLRRLLCRLCGLLGPALLWPMIAVGMADEPLGEEKGPMVRSVRIDSDGPILNVSSEDLHKLILVREGEALSPTRVKQSIQRLYSTRLFYDVQALSEPDNPSPNDEVEVTFLLIRKYLIDQISFSGNVRLPGRLLRREVLLRPDEPYADELLERSLSQLQDLYQRHGYYQAGIEPVFKPDHDRARLGLEVQIEAGRQARVADLQLDIESGIEPGEVYTSIQTRRGGLFSQVQLEEDIQRLERRLALRGYLRPNIFVRDGARYDAGSDTVELTLRINPREHSHIEFVGIDPEEEDLSDLLLFTERATAPALVEASARQIRTKLQNRGYFQARVDYEPIEAQGVDPGARILVDRGERSSLAEIRFEGNQFAEDGSLERIIRAQTSGFLSRGRYTEDLARDDVERIRSYYRRAGFLDAEVTHELKPGHPGSDRLILTYRVREGDRYVLQDLRIEGNEQIDLETLQNELVSQAGEPYSPMAVAQDRAHLIAIYEDRGFRQVEFRSEITHSDPNRVHVAYFIEEGPKYHVEQVITTGHMKTRPGVVEGEKRIVPGEPLSLGRLLETEANLYDLSVFSRVHVNEVPTYREPLEKNVMLHLEEARRYTLLYGLGFSSFEGVRGTFGLTNNNFMGTARALSLGLRMGAQRQRATLSYNMPRLFGRRAPTLVSLTADNERRLEDTFDDRRFLRGRPFDSFRLSATGQTERRVSLRESFFYRFRFENVRLDLPPGLEAPLQFFREERNLRLSSLSVSYINESRDDPIDPSEGFVLTGEALLSSRLIGSEKQFGRLLTQGQYYHSLFPDLLLALSLRIGMIGPFGDVAEGVDNPVPITERFFSGGATTLRGLPQDLAGPLLRDPETGEIILVDFLGEPDPDGRPVPLGGNFLAIGNVELRFPLAGPFKAALFYDVGNVFSRISAVTSERFTNTVGLGTRINTPVGPFRIDAGYNPEPPVGRGFSRWNFHFTLGHAF